MMLVVVVVGGGGGWRCCGDDDVGGVGRGRREGGKRPPSAWPPSWSWARLCASWRAAPSLVSSCSRPPRHLRAERERERRSQKRGITVRKRADTFRCDICVPCGWFATSVTKILTQRRLTCRLDQYTPPHLIHYTPLHCTTDSVQGAIKSTVNTATEQERQRCK